MQLHKLVEDIPVDLQMPRFLHPLKAHHVDERLVPFLHLSALLRCETVEPVDYILFDFGYIKVVGADYILDLPHIKDIFGYIAFAFLRCDNHIVET